MTPAAMLPPDGWIVATRVGGTGAAATIDIARRRIPNVVSLGLAAVGIALAASGTSGVTLSASLAGFVVALVLMLPGHLLGATGAGDVKLFAAVGAVLGLGRVFDAFLFTALAGGAVAVVIAFQRGRLRRTLAQTARLCGQPAETRKTIQAPAEHNRFPYGPAIAVGSVLAALF
jgi:prepilin peptidase CpaA